MIIRGAQRGSWPKTAIARGTLSSGAVRGLVALIRLYQRCISPALGPRCRFYPSCSSYCAEALTKHGLARGLLQSGVRLCKCHPFHRGGVDLP